MKQESKIGRRIYGKCPQSNENRMKLKASPHSEKIIVELDSQEAAFPPIAAADIALKKILVPIDFSDLSRKALHYAISFAQQFGAEIYLLHVVEIIIPTPEVVVAESEYLNVKVREQAAKELSEWRKEIVRVPVRSTIRDGSPFRQITEAADEINADLIVLGTQGRTGLSHLFIGSTAERVVRHAPCPVMIVREREHDFVGGEKHFAPAKKNANGRKLKHSDMDAWE